MPITRSAKKALRQSKRRFEQNTVRRIAYRNAIKKVRSLVASKNTKELQAAINAAYQALDKAAKTNALKKQTAARKKSRLMKFIHTALATK